MSTAPGQRVPHVDEAVNFRDLALGIGDWYNVTPSVRVAIEGLALVVQDQAARLERFDTQFGGRQFRGPPPGTPFFPGSHHDQAHSSEDMTMLIERVDRLSNELATTKAKLRAVETARGGAHDEMASAAERACDFATARAETAAREASAAARECRAIEQTTTRAETAAAEAVKARDTFSASLAVKTESSESRVRAAAAKAEVRCREAMDDVKRVECLVRDIDIAQLERDAGSIAQFTQAMGTIRELRRAVFGDEPGGLGMKKHGAPSTPFTPGGVSSVGTASPGMGRGGFGDPASLPLPTRLAEVEATTVSLLAAIEELRIGDASSAAVETLGVGLQQLHAAVGSSLKERPTVSVVLGMIEEQVLFSVNESRKASQLDEESVEQVAVAKVDELQASHLVLARRATAAAEAAAANTRRVGVLEDVARGMERRQRRTERLVDDVRNAWASVSADQETAIIRKIRGNSGGTVLQTAGRKKYEKAVEKSLAPRDDTGGETDEDENSSGDDRVETMEPAADKMGRLFGGT
jgi:hypothetical protein